ncbi:hypothetical protein [Acinetobacter junii]|uniref:hypothetical protein n=1 Tax=Acinetobacter junii TaxID=40215 RepID=UPI00148EF103|nr:hypothetical protein [Acinetobacter junii]
MEVGVPYDQAANMPLDLAIVILFDERPNNTHQQTTPPQRPLVTPQIQTNGASSTITKTYVTDVRKHSKPKG